MNKIIKNSLSATFVAAIAISATACDMSKSGSESESGEKTEGSAQLFDIQKLDAGIQVAELKEAIAVEEAAAVEEAVEVKEAVEAVEEKAEAVKEDTAE